MIRTAQNDKWKDSFLRMFIMSIILIALSVLNNSVAKAADGNVSEGELHAFYPTNATFSEQIKAYIDDLDSISFAWSRIDSEDPGSLNTVKGQNGNYGFYYPSDYIKPIEYAKSTGKSIQLNIYMDQSDGILLLPYAEKRAAMIAAIIQSMTTETAPGNGIYFDGVVIDFEGLRNTDTSGNQLIYEGKLLSAWFNQFLTELSAELEPLSKKLYVAVNPGLYYDGYDYAAIIDVADRVILMAHDYEPTQALQKNQVQQFTGYDAIEPVNSMAPILLVRQALNEITEAVTDSSKLSKVWLQITFDSAQWRYNVSSAAEWEKLAAATLSKEGRLTPLYKSIKARVDNTDGYGIGITYGYNNELQTPYIQYFNSSDKSWNVILYEDSRSISAKIDLAEEFGFGGISLWSLANVPDYTDANGLKYYLDGWTTITEQMSTYGQQTQDTQEYVTFKDDLVEQAVREKLGKTSGKITVEDMKSIYRIKLPVGVTALTDLTYMTNLEYLDAQQLGIKSITPLAKLTNLRVLYLQRNQISDVSTLKMLTKLEVLSLNGNQVVDISGVATLTKLQKLYLRENKITSITSLAKLSNLTILELGENSITKIDSVKKLTKLTQLSLDNNKITDITALKNLTSLQSLYLQRNSISSITALSGLKKLTLLSLNGNQIVYLKSLSGLASLEKLYLKENKITAVTAIKSLSKLTELYLSGNKITDYSPLKSIYQKTGFSCDFKL